MKIARLFVLATVAFVGCTSTPENKDKHLVSKQLYNVDLGKNTVHGVRLKLTTDLPMEELGAKVQLNAENKTWVDTLYLELRKNDTVVTEAIFSEANLKDYPKVEANVEFFEL